MDGSTISADGADDYKHKEMFIYLLINKNASNRFDPDHPHVSEYKTCLCRFALVCADRGECESILTDPGSGWIKLVFADQTEFHRSVRLTVVEAHFI
jgi:hypothetical protein